MKRKEKILQNLLPNYVLVNLVSVALIDIWQSLNASVNARSED
jgi:hypothetical protein